MQWLIELRYGLRAFAVPVIVLLLFVYAGFHLLTGERSLLVWRQLRAQVAETTAANAALTAQRDQLTARVARLQPAQLDADYIDELARRHLALLQPADLVIFLPYAQQGGQP